MLFFKKKDKNHDKIEKEHAEFLKDKEKSLKVLEFEKAYGGYKVYTTWKDRLKSKLNSIERLVFPDTYEGEPVIEIANIPCLKALKNIVLPDTLTRLGDCNFWHNKNVAFYEYDNAYYLGNPNNNYLALIKAKDKDITSCTVCQSTKIIYVGAFSGCKNLQNVVFEDNASLVNLDDWAFEGCKALESIILPKSLQMLGTWLFADCDNLKSIFYEGTIEDFWKALDKTNWLLKPDLKSGALYDDDRVHYYSEEEPKENGNLKYWHYVDGVPTVW